jgi:hypothetical protein
VRRVVGSNDKSASHATRLAGTENWKAKYLPNPPVVRILEAHPGRIMTPAQLEPLGLLAAPEPEILICRCISPPPCSPVSGPRTAEARLPAVSAGCPAQSGRHRPQSQPRRFLLLQDGGTTRLERRRDCANVVGGKREGAGARPLQGRRLCARHRPECGSSRGERQAEGQGVESPQAGRAIPRDNAKKTP